MQFQELIGIIEDIAPLANAASWDTSGLQVAARRSEVTRLAVCLDPTPASVTHALQAQAHCVLSHHPLALKPTLPKRLDAYHETLRLLFQANVPLYAAHTSLDTNSNGPAAWLAEELQLRHRRVLEPLVAAPAADGHAPLPPGYGLVGELPTPLRVRDIAACIAQHVPLPYATVCGTEPSSVSRLAYCTGSGASLLEAAQKAGAEVFITGDVKYHTALAADICLLDVGHHSLEEEMMRRMQVLLQQRLPGVEVIFLPSSPPLRPLIL